MWEVVVHCSITRSHSSFGTCFGYCLWAFLIPNKISTASFSMRARVVEIYLQFDRSHLPFSLKSSIHGHNKMLFSRYCWCASWIILHKSIFRMAHALTLVFFVLLINLSRLICKIYMEFGLPYLISSRSLT